MLRQPVREPRKVGGGTGKEAEHGLGAGLSIGRESRERPLTRFEANILSLLGCRAACGDVRFCESRWYRVGFVALGVFRGRL